MVQVHSSFVLCQPKQYSVFLLQPLTDSYPIASSVRNLISYACLQFYNKMFLPRCHRLTLHGSKNVICGSNIWQMCISFRCLLLFQIYCCFLSLGVNVIAFSALTFWYLLGTNLFFTFNTVFSLGLHNSFAWNAKCSFGWRINLLPFVVVFKHFSSGTNQPTKSRSTLDMPKVLVDQVIDYRTCWVFFFILLFFP